MITHEIVNYGRYGRCIAVSDGCIELYATLDIGPRLIRYAAKGGENMFYEQPDFDINQPTEGEYSAYGDKGVFHIYGGHRLWTSPEAMPRTYYPDNSPVEYTLKDDTLILTPPPQAWTNLQMQMEVTFCGDGKIKVVHKITNIGPWDCKFAPWSLTVMSTGGLEIMPQPTTGPRYLNNRIFTFWTYSNLSDERVHFGDKYITLEQKPLEGRPFKIGYNNTHGFSAYLNKGSLFIKRFAYVEGGTYSDDGMNFETYTNQDILEIESLGQLKAVAPGETVQHEEHWELIANVERPGQSETEIDEFLNKYVKD